MTESPADETFARRLGRERYQVLSRLGAGAHGVVYRVRDRQTGHMLALKVLKDVTPARLERFRREAHLAASLQHAGIVRVHVTGEVDGRPFIGYELVEGARPLDVAWRDLPVRRRVELVRDVARALGHAHARGVVHRDVKAENVLVDAEGRPRVTDFGAALALDEQDRLTRTGALVGTPQAMAPEQLAGRGAIGPPADVWALGVLLYEALAERRPFDAGSFYELATQIAGSPHAPPSSVAPGAPRELDPVVAAALAKAPERRFAHGDALADALDAWLAGRATTASRVAWPSVRVQPRTAVAVACMGVALTLLSAALLYDPRPQVPRADGAVASVRTGAPGRTPAPAPATGGGPRPIEDDSPERVESPPPGLAGIDARFVAAAEAGDTTALLFVANALRESADPRDYHAAVRYCRRAADLGEPSAMVALAEVLHDGRPEPAQDDLAEAERLLRRAVDLGHPSAMKALGEALREGTLGRPDLPAAIELLRQAVAANASGASYELAMTLFRTGSSKDREEARRRLEALAGQGRGIASVALGDLLLKDDDPAARARGLTLLERTAEEGSWEAMLSLAAHAGERGDRVGRVRWLGQAARAAHDGACRGHRWSMNALADLLERGEGVVQDVEAAAWWRSAALEMHPPGAAEAAARAPVVLVD